MSQNPEPETSIGEYPLYISHCYLLPGLVMVVKDNLERRVFRD